ncbi:histone-lysine N-methyltransferase, H3 lysine-9 specific SUVH4 [Iris pallida]|uniref:Histone-lysine N-methyltransferase, H3 lysine-9 specific SUVH4 n=1 Tax=Iris pallida TaxID=29817 RepID=A0AAX6IET8_IRIPA|nr:histone-lysine N-methyltransferase, H3 lysine-9 specific SUVH4 [Iris pallida]
MATSTVTTPNAASGGSAGRTSRLPRWTRQEILVLVQGKTAHERGLSPPQSSAEPKWSAVSAYCQRHGVDRGPLQCRKRWSNLACDFKKIKKWEGEGGSGASPSFWEMRSDLRRERKLPGFFDREVFELMDGAAVGVEREEEEEVVFDSGRSAREDGLFSDNEEEDNEEEEPPLLVTPLSEKKYQPFENEHSHPGNPNDKQQTDNNPAKGSSSWEAQKRRRTSEGLEETKIENKLIQVLERNGKIISDHLEAQNINCQLDRDQRKDQVDGLVDILTKLADALGRIADKL